MNEYKQKYELWLEKVTDEDVRKSLLDMTDEEIKNAFTSDLAFGTGGLRGIMSAGTDRMNVYTVYRASEGVAKYMLAHGMKAHAVFVLYDEVSQMRPRHQRYRKSQPKRLQRLQGVRQ